MRTVHALSRVLMANRTPLLALGLLAGAAGCALLADRTATAGGTIVGSALLGGFADHLPFAIFVVLIVTAFAIPWALVGNGAYRAVSRGRASFEGSRATTAVGIWAAGSATLAVGSSLMRAFDPFPGSGSHTGYNIGLAIVFASFCVMALGARTIRIVPAQAAAATP